MGTELLGTVLTGSGDGWYRGGCEGDEKFTGNDDSGIGADGIGGLVRLGSVIRLYDRSGMPSTPGATGGTVVDIPPAGG